MSSAINRIPLQMSDRILLLIGKIAVNYTRLEKEVAVLVERYLSEHPYKRVAQIQPTVRASLLTWRMTKLLIESEVGPMPPKYELLFEKFDEITRARNMYLRGTWEVDCQGQSWVTPPEEPGEAAMAPRHITETMLANLVDELEDAIRKVSAIDNA